MQEFYKGHYICSGAEPVPGSTEWRPTVEVCWSDGAFDFMRRWLDGEFTLTCATEKLAEIEAHLFAREWINAGKTTPPPPA
jgi:hypothetical protein